LPRNSFGSRGTSTMSGSHSAICWCCMRNSQTSLMPRPS
jgi:hypothetical protein